MERACGKRLYLISRMLIWSAVPILDPRQLASTCSAFWQFGNIETFATDSYQCRADPASLQGSWIT
jgi:hypothetical protein